MKLLIFILGLEFGSFANVCIFRWPRDGSSRRPNRSFCPSCQTQLRWFDNVPLLSFIFLKGKCRTCQTPISWRYPFVELLMALIWLGIYILCVNRAEYNSLPFMASLFLFSFFLLVTTFTDLDWKIIPDQASYGMALSALILSPWNPLLGEGIAWNRAMHSFIGAIIGGGIIYLIGVVGGFIMKKEVMGGGDVKLMAGFGAFLGFEGALWVLFLGSLLGGIIAGIGLLSGHLKRHQYIPFGPFLNAAAASVLLLKLFEIDPMKWNFFLP